MIGVLGSNVFLPRSSHDLMAPGSFTGDNQKEEP